MSHSALYLCTIDYDVKSNARRVLRRLTRAARIKVAPRRGLFTTLFSNFLLPKFVPCFIALFGRPERNLSTSRYLADNMDLSNLKRASDYLNGLLLSRGLLKHGKSIDFIDSGGSPETLARIINLVHDLVTRRDVSMS